MSDEMKSDQLPIIEDETVAPLDVVTDLVLDSTIPAPIRKNAFKALDRLCSALIDVPVGALERRSAEKRAKTEARIKIIEENTAQIVEQIKVPPEYARRAENKFAEKIIQEQVNLDKISVIAANVLKQEESTSTTDQSGGDGEEKIINDDWLNSFEVEARQKSTEEMQLLFGRILAGKIRKPGTYSTRTVKLLAQLDRDVAILFKKLCSMCVVYRAPVAKQIFDARVPTLGGAPGRNTLGKYGLGFRELNILNEYGLIISEYNSWHEYNLGTGSGNHPLLAPLWHQGRYWALFALPGWDKNQQQFKLTGVALSHAGRELFPIVDSDSMEGYTEELKKFFAGQNLQMREINIANRT